MHMILKESVGI